jgi:ABC-2 type transport system permease protein
MREAMLVAKREYLERIRSKAFLFMTIAFPLLISLSMGGSFFASKLGGGHKHIVVASNDAALAHAVLTQLKSNKDSQQTVDLLAPATEEDHAALTRRVDSKDIDGYLWLETRGVETRGAQSQPGAALPDASYVSRGSADLFTAGTLESAVNRALMREELTKRGISSGEVDTLLQRVDLKTTQVKEGKTSSSDAMKSFFGAYIMVFLLYFVTVFYGMNVARSVVEEKTSRVFEVLLSTTRPESLMAGKLLGVGAAGMTQLGIWFAAAILLSGSTLAATLGKGGLASFGITGLQLAFFVVYFLLGFLFYSALAAGFGASVSNEQEIQQFSMIIVMPLLVGLILMTYILANPNALPVVLLSLFPPCTPVVMYLRISQQVPPWWQLALSVVLLIAFIWAAIWVASKIYRVGILMYGKRATLPEMLRWLRYS